MATLNSTYVDPDVDWGWITTFVNLGKTVALRTNQFLCLLNRRSDTANAAFYAVSPNNILIYNNSGGGDTTLQKVKSSTIDPVEGLLDAMGPNISTWGETATKNTAKGFGQQRLEKLISDESLEKLNHRTRGNGINYGDGLSQGIGIGSWNALPQSNWFNQGYAEGVHLNGGEHFGAYAGSVNTGKHFQDIGTGPLRTALASGANALTWCQANPLFGDGAFSKSEYTFRGVSVKCYDAGDDQKNRALLQTLTDLEITQKALVHLNHTRGRMAVFFPGYSEILDNTRIWHTFYRRVTPQGGTVTRATFPQWSYGYQIFAQTFAMIRGYHCFNWESAEKFGVNPGVPYPDAANGGDVAAGVVLSGNVGPPAMSITGAPTNGPVGYPPNPQGGYDIPLVAADFYTFCHQWGGFDMAFCPHNRNGGTFTDGTATGYLIDRFQDNLGLCLKGVNGTQVSILYCSMLDEGATETVRFEIAPGNISPPVTAYGGQPQAFRYTL